MFVCPKLFIAYPYRSIAWFTLFCMTLSIAPAKSTRLALGPYGGQGGTQWSDEGYHSIVQFSINVGLRYIHSITIQYDKGGQFFWSDRHGGDGGLGFSVLLRYPDEFITSVSGYIDNITHHISSITFETNMGNRKGPYGLPGIGEPFASPKNQGKAVGFFGRSGDYLDAIGLYMRTD